MLYSKLTCQILYTEETKTCETKQVIGLYCGFQFFMCHFAILSDQRREASKGLFLDLLFCAKYVFMEGPRHLFRQVLRRLSKTILVFFFVDVFFVAIC